MISCHRKMYVYSFFVGAAGHGCSVDVDSTCGPDLSFGAGAHADPAHVDHGDGEVGEEGLEVGGVVHELHVGAGEAVVEQRGVGGEQRPAAVHGLVVAGVELGGRHGVQRLHAHHVLRRAHLLQLVGVVRV
jgi:hypothetical protein